jgi:hypothetical protein
MFEKFEFNGVCIGNATVLFLDFIPIILMLLKQRIGVCVYVQTVKQAIIKNYV